PPLALSFEARSGTTAQTLAAASTSSWKRRTLHPVARHRRRKDVQRDQQHDSSSECPSGRRTLERQTQHRLLLVFHDLFTLRQTRYRERKAAAAVRSSRGAQVA